MIVLYLTPDLDAALDGVVSRRGRSNDCEWVHASALRAKAQYHITSETDTTR